MGKVLFFIFSSLLVFGVTLYFRLGGHKEVRLDQESRSDFFIIYKEHRGAYHKINDVITQVESLMAQKGQPCSKTFGEYLDDPRAMEERHLRSNGGCVFPFALDSSDLPEGFLARKVTAQNWLVAHFDGAPSISPMKVYPRVAEWFAANNKKMPATTFEIYTVINPEKMETEYLFNVL